MLGGRLREVTATRAKRRLRPLCWQGVQAYHPSDDGYDTGMGEPTSKHQKAGFRLRAIGIGDDDANNRKYDDDDAEADDELATNGIFGLNEALTAALAHCKHCIQGVQSYIDGAMA